MYAVYETTTGELKSTGTVLGDLPETLTSVELNEVDADKLRSGEGIWDSATLTVIDNPNYVQPEADLTIPVSALDQLQADMNDTNVNSIAEIKTSLKTFVETIKS